MALRDFARRTAGLLADTRGGMAATFAVTLPILVGGLGFGTEAGMWYFNQRKLQNAADVAAYAAATELRAGRPMSRLEAAAAAAADRSGHVQSRGTVTVQYPPSSGAFTGNLRSVEVQVDETIPRLFSGLFVDGPIFLGGRAVAQVTEGLPTCVLALHPSASRAIQIGGNSNTTLTGCNVHANSLAPDAAYVHGNARLETDCISSAGGVGIEGSADLRLTGCVAKYENADVVPDPFAGLPAPPNGPSRTASGSPLEPGYYNGDLTLHGTVHLDPGVYVINGDLRINANARVTGDDVTIYLVGNSTLHVNGNAQHVQLSAPRTGPYADVLIYADRTSTGTPEHTINGNSGTLLDGALYFPAGDVKVNGNALNSGGCTPLIGQEVMINGTARLDVDCTGRSLPGIRSSRLIVLVE